MTTLRMTLALLISMATGASGATSIVFVDETASGANDGSSWNDAYVELRDALAGASDLPSGTTIEVWVAAGTYTTAPPGGSRTSPFALHRGYELYGGFAGIETDRSERDPVQHPTILSGDLNGDDGPDFANETENGIHVLWVVGAAIGPRVLDGFTIRGGFADGASYAGRGAGMVTFGQDVTVRRCVFEGNHAVLDGGAIYNESPAHFDTCVVRGNHAGDRGGGVFNNWSHGRFMSCTVEQNVADGFGGGGVYNEHGGATFADCHFQANEAAGLSGNGYGGAMANTQSSVSLSDCEFSTNSALQLGGAVLNQQNSPAFFEDCRFEENSTGAGAAIENLESDPVLVGCLFLSNHGTACGAFDNGGDASPLFTNCRFLGNETTGAFGDGGAVRNGTGDPRFVGCLFSGNTSARNGGAIAALSFGTLRLVNCTVSRDSAAEKGGGIYAHSEFNSISLDNCVVYGNGHSFAAGQKSELNAPAAGVFTVNYTCVEGWSGSLGGAGNTGADPLFTNPAGPDGVAGTEDDDYRLGAGSPCVDAADNSALPPDSLDLDMDGDVTEAIPFDLSGGPRFVDDPASPDSGNGAAPIVDMGAFEFGGVATTVASGVPSARGPLSLRSAPNPFNPNTEIRYRLAKPGVVRLTVHDVTGRLVATIDEGPHPAGDRVVRWNGKDSNGRSAASGVYLLRLVVPGQIATKRIALVR